MSTTTIRVDTATHTRLVELSNAGGRTLIETVRDAAEALERLRFAGQAATEMHELSQDPEAWAAYIDEATSLPTSDGIG